ncbi:hypothetical protein J2X56_003012 [Herbaspirillum sp. 1173]|uniref:DEAD/DEAH box helicase n=1 Tax=Herbaspirillum sp. 1173 TaxID=2817734 RepID=UPI00285BA6FB|nr:DEAD/DEAH box helicase [Herbaspirillum sp. 1173]MDR6740988.1 hypothetical protein [Herbaspirillum sp. 1173]
MFDFKSLVKAPPAEMPATLGALFSQLDRKATHTSLRPVQVSALGSLDKYINERDLVIKLSTGSGKTVVGLVYAEMMRRRYKAEPVVYLCPTTQLVDQVLQTAVAIGVPVTKFPVKGLPYEALSGDNVLVCTYDRLFNAKSTFENKIIRPSCFVLDDVHAGMERTKQCYTARVPEECYEQIKGILHPLCERTDPATWRGISSNANDSRFEVPYWIWAGVQAQVCDILQNYKDEGELLFRWDNINRYAELARVCISGTSVEIALPVAAIEENLAYSNAKHRLFMSASIKDGASLITDLACDPAAFTRVIEPPEDEGAGERMILPTSLISPEVTKQQIAAVCATLSKIANVVVLTSSTAQARVWEEGGATLYSGKDVDAAIDHLRTTTRNFAVFAQRFDGVDLPDDACRVLVIDGVPTGDRLCDQVDSSRQKDSPEYDIRTVNKFEQALGRAVRSSADYAAVLLVGPDIAAFIGKKSVRALFEGRTDVQVELGKELAKMGPGKSINDVVLGMVTGLLTRNEGWKEAHRARVSGAPKVVRKPELTQHEQVAVAYRESWKFAKARNFQAAIPPLRQAANALALHPIQRAELTYRIATYLHQFDPAAAVQVYAGVFDANSDFPRPDIVADKRFVRVTDQAVAACQFYGQFISANAAIARLDEIRAKLSFALPAEVVEQGLCELGIALGATSSRPEKSTGRGPDDLWIFDDIAFCLEAKSEKHATIHKSDAGQLTLSLQWCHQFVDIPANAIFPIFVTNVTQADRKEDVAFAPVVLTEELVFGICDRLRQLVVGLSFDGPLFTDPAAIGQRMKELNLGGRQILAHALKVTWL